MQYIAYGVFGVSVLVFLVFGIIIVYHLLRYRFIGDASIFMVVMYIAVAAVILIFSTTGVVRTDWDQYGITLGTQTIQQPVKSSGPLFR